MTKSDLEFILRWTSGGFMTPTEILLNAKYRGYCAINTLCRNYKRKYEDIYYD